MTIFLFNLIHISKQKNPEHLKHKKKLFCLPKLQFFVLLFFTLQSFALSSCLKKRSEKDSILLKVNDLTMTTGEFGELLVQKLSLFDPLSLKEESLINDAKSKIIDEFVLKSASIKWAKENNVFVRKEDLDREINSYLKSYKSELSFREALLKKGMSFNTWKKKIHFSLLQKLIYNKVVKNVSDPSEGEIKTHYQKQRNSFQSLASVRLRQVVTQTENEAKLILEQLKKGRDFKELAKKFSISPEGKNGGDTGWIEKGVLPVFEKAFSMRVGQMSGVLKSPYGYHIYELVSKKKKQTLSFSKVRDKILKNLREEEEQKVYSQWLKKQIESLTVTKNDQLIEKIKVYVDT